MGYRSFDDDHDTDRCCPADHGGSHYHCVLCGCTCSMVGHAKGEDRMAFCPPPDQRPAWAEQFVDRKELSKWLKLKIRREEEAN